MSSSDTDSEFQNQSSPQSRPSASASASSSSESVSPSSDDESENSPSRRKIANRHMWRGFPRRPKSEEDPPSGKARQERTYSDSENSFEHGTTKRIAREGKGMFDLEAYSESLWAQRSLLDNLAAEEIDSLVGWAHSGVAPRNQFLSGELADFGGASIGEQQDDASIQNPLFGLVNTPLPLSYLNYFVHRGSQIPEFRPSLDSSFDDSALVAVGMIVEDMITASLLPLAGFHVLRCQQIEQRPTEDEALLNPLSQVNLSHPISRQPVTFDPRNIPKDEAAFTAWTLPPEEAMFKLAFQGMVPDTGIPLVRDPIRSSGVPGKKTFQVCSNNDIVTKMFRELSNDRTLLTLNKELWGLMLIRKRYKKKQSHSYRENTEDDSSVESQNKRQKITEI